MSTTQPCPAWDGRIPQRLYGIIGHPLAQTLSPLLHNWGFARLGLPASYLAFPTPPGRLGEVMAAVRALPVSGLSVTIPHKEALLPLLDEVTDLARSVGAVNTLFWREGRLVGHNTDVEGFTAPLRVLAGAGASLDSALVLGAGGAARAVMAGLAELGAGRVYVANRDPDRARSLAEEWGAQAVPWQERAGVDARLVVNSTPMGMAGKAPDLSPIPPEFWRPGRIAYDLVYNPLRTLFLRQAEAGGAQTVDGLAMFAAQGAAQFRLWTGLEPPMDEAVGILRQALS